MHLRLLGHLDQVPGRPVRLGETRDRLRQLPHGGSDRGEQVDVVTDATDETTGLTTYPPASR